jgi:hypothetical protein
VLLHVALRDQNVEQQRTAWECSASTSSMPPSTRRRNRGHSSPRCSRGCRGTGWRSTSSSSAVQRSPARILGCGCLEALRLGLARALLFDGTGRPEQPSTVLRKRSLIVEGLPVVTDPVDPRALVATALAALDREERSDHHPMLLLDVRLEQLTASGERGSPGDHLDALTARAPIIVTDQTVLHPVVEYLRRYTSAPVRLVTSVAVFADLLSGSYETLPGALLESLGKLLVEDVRLYLYPVPIDTFGRARTKDPRRRVTASPSGGKVTLDDLRCEPPLDHLLRYLQGAGWLVPLELP